jgi:hypothetical protein
VIAVAGLDSHAFDKLTDDIFEQMEQTLPPVTP